MEKPEPDVMRRPPRAPNEAVITRKRALLIGLYGAVIACVTTVGFALAYGWSDQDVPHSRTVAFTIMAYAQLFFSFGCRSERYAMPRLGLFSNPHLFWAIALSGLLQLAVVTFPPAQHLFRTSGMRLWEWLVIMPLALLPVTLIEVVKLARLRKALAA
jgi:Ca2+-transporting ATPase